MSAVVGPNCGLIEPIKSQEKHIITRALMHNNYSAMLSNI